MKQTQSQPLLTLKNEDLKTMTACMQSLQKQGFTENFMVTERGLFSVDSELNYEPQHTKILSFYRFEGETDPADSTILYAIETKDGIRGLLSDSYGANADAKVAKFITEVQTSVNVELNKFATEQTLQSIATKDDYKTNTFI